MHESIDGGVGHRLITEDLTPLREGCIGGDGDAFVFVTFADQFEEHGGFSLIAPDVREIVEDDQIKTIELGQFLRKAQIAPRGLKALDQIGAAREEHAFARIDQGVPDPAQ